MFCQVAMVKCLSWLHWGQELSHGSINQWSERPSIGPAVLENSHWQRAAVPSSLIMTPSVKWCDMKIMRQGWAGQTSVWGHTFYPSIYLNNTGNVLWMSIIRTEFVWPVGFHAFAEIKDVPVIFLSFFFFCNEMQQMCNLVGKHTTASRYDLGGKSLTAAFN